MTSIAERVFGVTELLEHILINVSFRDLYVVERVSRTFLATIRESSVLQQKIRLQWTHQKRLYVEDEDGILLKLAEGLLFHFRTNRPYSPVGGLEFTVENVDRYLFEADCDRTNDDWFEYWEPDTAPFKYWEPDPVLASMGFRRHRYERHTCAESWRRIRITSDNRPLALGIWELTSHCGCCSYADVLETFKFAKGQYTLGDLIDNIKEATASWEFPLCCRKCEKKCQKYGSRT